jgi:hypothetical protein
MPPKLSHNEFITKARAIHGDKYNYLRTSYSIALKKVVILCPQHGEFLQFPFNHLKGSGCPKCGIDVRTGARFDTQEFILRARASHGDKYDYSKAVYTGFSTSVEIVCLEHGLFFQRANNHIAGIGCPKCAMASKRDKLLKIYTVPESSKLQPTNKSALKDNQRVFLCNCGRETVLPAYAVEKGKIKTCGKCSYKSKGFWLSQRWGMLTLVGEQKLPDEWSPFSHQEFDFSCSCSKTTRVRMADIIDGHTMSCGCRIPGKGEGSPVREIEDYITGLNIPFESDNRSVIAPLELDIWIPSHNLAIEFNGQYYHSLDGTKSPLAKYRHRDKFRSCQEKGILLLQVDEHEWKSQITKTIWKSIIASKLGAHKRVFARDTVFESISKEEAEDFLLQNHLQGETPVVNHEWCFALSLRDKVVGVIAFARHEKKYLNLTRMAFPLGMTVVGGAQKLFKNALKFLPKIDIVTFSNNRYSAGAVYPKIGFVHDAELPPSYQWYFRGRIWNKRLLRRKHLPALLGAGFDPVQTADENLYRNGARCLYDAGYERWVYKQS